MQSEQTQKKKRKYGVLFANRRKFACASVCAIAAAAATWRRRLRHGDSSHTRRATSIASNFGYPMNCACAAIASSLMM